MATQDKDFKVKNGLQVGGPTNLVNYTSSSPSNPFVGQLWVDSDEDSAEADLSAYLTITAASSTYLSILEAESTYLPISASSDFITESQANNLYDLIGSASAAELNAKSYSDSLSVNYDVIGSASAAEFNAKTYADSLALNYEIAGSASAAITNLIDAAPETLNTLNELAAALGDDPNFATSTASALGQRLTIANASATYLTISDAESTYLPISASSSFNGGISELGFSVLTSAVYLSTSTSTIISASFVSTGDPVWVDFSGNLYTSEIQNYGYKTFFELYNSTSNSSIIPYWTWVHALNYSEITTRPIFMRAKVTLSAGTVNLSVRGYYESNGFPSVYIDASDGQFSYNPGPAYLRITSS